MIWYRTVLVGDGYGVRYWFGIPCSISFFLMSAVAISFGTLIEYLLKLELWCCSF